MTANTNERSGRPIRNVPKCAEEAGVSEKTIRREIKAGNIEIVRLGPGRRRIGITDAAWQAYLRSRTS